MHFVFVRIPDTPFVVPSLRNTAVNNKKQVSLSVFYCIYLHAKLPCI